MHTIQPSNLFNCCRDAVEPDYSRFRSLEVGPVVAFADDEGYTACEMVAYHPEFTAGKLKPDFWTVYARTHEGYADALSDHPCEDEAMLAARTYAMRGELPILPI